MKSLTVRISDQLHKQLKFKVIEKETTIQNYIVELIKKDLGETEQKNKGS